MAAMFTAVDPFAALSGGLLSPWLEANNQACEAWLAWNTSLWQTYLRGLEEWSSPWQVSLDALPFAWSLRGAEQLA